MTTPPISAAPATAAAQPVSAKPQTDKDKLRQTAQQFEAVFLRQMIGSMRQASLGEDLLGGDAVQQFRDMSDARLADTMAGKGTLGVADLLVRQFGARVAPAAAAASTVPAAAIKEPAK